MTWGWAGNIFIIGAMFCIAKKWRIGWVLSFIGNVLWCWYAICLNMMDMLSIDVIALCLAAYGYWNWRSHDCKTTEACEDSRGKYQKDCKEH